MLFPSAALFAEAGYREKLINNMKDLNKQFESIPDIRNRVAATTWKSMEMLLQISQAVQSYESNNAESCLMVIMSFIIVCKIN